MRKEWEGEGEREREERGGEINNTYVHESIETISLEYQDISVSIICQHKEILLHNHKQPCYIRQER